jgi:hypothetical protein
MPVRDYSLSDDRPMTEPVPQPPDDELDLGVAGASARREHERRRAAREQRTREAHPRIGGLLFMLKDDPRHEAVWARGAGGEEFAAEEFVKHCSEHVLLLHDRRMPRSRANIDHIAICAHGIWVIDSKRYKGKVVINNPWFGEKTLKIAGRDQSKLIAGLTKQVDLVKTVLAETAPGIPVQGAVAFMGDGLPALGKLSFKGYPIRYPKQLAKLLNADGELTPEMVRALAIELARRFPAA